MAEREPSDATKRPDAAMVERTCRECKGSGVAEYIDHWARPCDICHGEGFLRFTMNEDGLLDQCESLSARVAELAEALEPFAEVADEYDDSDDDHHEVWIDAGPEKVIRAAFSLRNFRRARTALGSSTASSSGDA
jgi:hypothetical protein